MKIKKMPSKRMLEDFLDNGSVKVYFNSTKGEFKRNPKRKKNE